MKKVIILLLVFVLNFGSASSFAQAKKQDKKVENSDKKSGANLKKDGSPDMRYKENKDAAKPAPKKLKKDGTPDKRYKDNK